MTGPVEPALLALIGEIYDCVIDPSRWPATVEHIRLRYGFFNAILGVNEAPSGRVLLQVVQNVPADKLHLIEEMGNHVLDLWGGWPRLSLLPLEEPVLQSDASDPASWPDNPYFRAFGMSQGIVDTLAIGLAMDSATVASLAFGRHGSERPLTAAAMDELRALGPHLRRAVIIGRMLDISTSAAANFAAALNASSAGVVLVDGSMRIVHANRAATSMLGAQDPVRETAGRLQLTRELAPGALQTAVQNAARSDLALGGQGMGIPARRLDGRPLTVSVMPLEQRTVRTIDAAAVAAVFIADASAGAPPAADLFSIAFDLTPAEGRIFAHIAEGKDAAEIARTLAITPATFKTHLSRIYAKTGRHDRAELVRLAAEIKIPG